MFAPTVSQSGFGEVESQGGFDSINGILRLLGHVGAGKEADHAKKIVEDVIEQVPLLRMANSAASMGENVLDGLSQVLQYLKESAPYILGVGCVGFALAAWHFTIPSLKYVAIACGIGAVVAGTIKVYHLVELLSTLNVELSDDPPIVSHATPGDVSKVVSLAVSMLSALHVPTTVGAVINFFKSLGSIERGVESAIKSVIEFIQWIGGKIAPDFTARHVDPLFAPPTIKVWLAEVNEVHLKAAQGRLPYTGEVLQRIGMLVEEGESFIIQSKRFQSEHVNATILRYMSKLIQFRDDNATRFQVSSVTRPRPVVNVLIGDPGLGKSSVAAELAKILVLDALADAPADVVAAFKSNQASRIFFGTADKFDDGLTSETIVYVNDDWRQERPQYAGEGSSGMKFLQMASSHRYTPRMAALEKKNSVGCAFPHMILSTNHTTAIDETVTYHQATSRRHDFVWKVSLKPGTRKGKIDYKNWTFELFIVDKSHTYVTTGQFYTFAEVVCASLELARARHLAWESALSADEGFFKQSRESRKEMIKKILDRISDEVASADEIRQAHEAHPRECSVVSYSKRRWF
jgi:hypothetical protein